MASLAYADMASEHNNRKVKHESHVDCDWKYPTYLEAVSKAVTIGDGTIVLDRVITKTIKGCCFKWELS